jgi:hypothetical protein
MGKMRKIARFLWLKWGSYVLTAAGWDSWSFLTIVVNLVETRVFEVSFY